MKYDIYFTKAKDAGIEELELSVNTTYSLSIGWFRGELESYSTSKITQLSARGTVNGKAGYVNSEKIDRTTPDFVISNIINNAKVNSSTDEVIIFKGSEHYNKKKVYNAVLHNTPSDEKIALLKEIEHRIKSADERISDVELGYSEECEEYSLFNSYGLNLKSKGNYFSIYASAVATGTDGATKTGGKFVVETDLNNLDIEALCDEVVDSTISQLNGAPCLSKKYRAVLNAETVASLMGFFVSNAVAEEVQKNTSLFKGKLNQLVASKKVTIEERPLDKTPAFRYFDDEGVATYNKKIINKGILDTYLYNLTTAKKDGVTSTGNGYSRGGKVSTSYSNLVLKPGKKSEKELLEEVNEGIYITDVEGLHAGMNAQSGNFSLQAKGYLIENGKRGKPVCLITVAGNLFDIFKHIQEVGNNSTRSGNKVASSVIVKSISVSGI